MSVGALGLPRGYPVKNGLLVYSDKYELFNIGDYIQSLAARQFLEKVDTLVCREALRDYAGEEIRLILNGWFTHEPDNWPPSSRIRPLFVSFHMNSVAQEKLTSDESISYLKKWGPIGCRDKDTVRLLRTFGVDAHFTGCLTLTLGLTWKRAPSDGAIYFVDPHFQVKRDPISVMGFARTLLSNYRVVSRIAARMFGSVGIKSLLKSSAFYGCYRRLFSDEVLSRAIYVKQEIANVDAGDDQAKFGLAEKLLRQYASARFVVTSRIHCALPCLGIGTPVLYVEDQQQSETSSCRLNGLRELFHVVKSDRGRLSSELSGEKITPEFSFNNKDDHRVFAERLTRACAAFAETPE